MGICRRIFEKQCNVFIDIHSFNRYVNKLLIKILLFTTTVRTEVRTELQKYNIKIFVTEMLTDKAECFRY